jgi:hypothetical protein
MDRLIENHLGGSPGWGDEDQPGNHLARQLRLQEERGSLQAAPRNTAATGLFGPGVVVEEGHAPAGLGQPVGRQGAGRPASDDGDFHRNLTVRTFGPRQPAS